MPQHLDFSKYTLGWICALPLELAAALLVLDQEHAAPAIPLKDNSTYHFGSIHQHNVVIACLPHSRTGTNSAASVARDMLRTFPIDLVLMVGVAGGIPSKKHDVRLGDVVIGQPQETHGGVIQYDFGRFLEDGTLHASRWLNRPPQRVLGILASTIAREMIDDYDLEEAVEIAARKAPSFARSHHDRSPDRLFESTSSHVESAGSSCDLCDQTKIVARKPRLENRVRVHQGTILSGNTLMRNGLERDRYLEAYPDAVCFEMESSGVYEDCPCIVIRGICDYSDSHKNKTWQNYAALSAATYAKRVVATVNPATPSLSSETDDLVSSVAAIEAEHDSKSGSLDLWDIPNKVLAVNQWFGRQACMQQKSQQSQAIVPMTRKFDSLNADAESVTLTSSRNRDSSTGLQFGTDMPLSVAISISSTVLTDEQQADYSSDQNAANVREFFDLQRKALTVLSTALSQFVASSHAYRLLRCIVNTARKVPTPISMSLADNITFIDANNDKHSLPIEYFRGWQTFNSMIQDRFRGHPGFHKIRSYQYSISMAGSSQAVLDGQSWRTVRPGTTITMDILFPNMTIQSNRCPACQRILRRTGKLAWSLWCGSCEISYSTGQLPRHEVDALALRKFPSSLYSEKHVHQHLKAHDDKAWFNIPESDGHPGLYATPVSAVRLTDHAGHTPRLTPGPNAVDALQFIRPEEDSTQVSRPSIGPLRSTTSELGDEAVASSQESDATSEAQPQNVEDMYEETGERSALSLFRRARLHQDSQLYHACLARDLDKAMQLMQRVLHVDDQRGPWGTCLTAAILSDSTEIVRDILSSGADPLLDVEPLGTPLRVAALHDRDPIIFFLLFRARQNVHRGYSDWSIYTGAIQEALRVATIYGSLRATRCLLLFGANPFLMADNGTSPFLDSIRLFSNEILSIFIAKASDSGLLSPYENRILSSYAATLKGKTRLGLLSDVFDAYDSVMARDEKLGHCLSEMYQGRGRILQSWMTARLKVKGPWEWINGSPAFERFFSTDSETYFPHEHDKAGLPGIIVTHA